MMKCQFYWWTSTRREPPTYGTVNVEVCIVLNVEVCIVTHGDQTACHGEGCPLVGKPLDGHSQPFFKGSIYLI